MGSLKLAQGSPKRLRNLYAAADRSFVHPAAVKKRVPYMDATAKQPLVISTPPCPVQCVGVTIVPVGGLRVCGRYDCACG